ncbi:MAG: alpha-L-fucosidase [Clostridiales bacterium]|nr:alpha-L-fucosidase [Clostridiales bacterium]
MNTLEKRLTQVIPSGRQLKWQELEFYAFIHYGINQFTDSEWGTGGESPEIFNPAQLNTDQWCESIKKAGMRAVILTAKHHDGFCLWDTKHTNHCVMNSPYGKDIVAQLALSCQKYGLKLGIYLSPWDRHDTRYGTGKAYDDYFCAQLSELLTGYGEIFCCWFDGACGECANGKKQNYDWDRYYSLIRCLQPNAVISVCGPDVRWCGNEAGHCRESEWSVVAASMADNEKVQENSQREDGEAFRKRIPSQNEDLGSREVLADIPDLIWYPAEVNTSIRPGWFYHTYEDEKVKSLEELTSVYLQSVGGNASFLLNIPPHPQGYFAPGDVKRLEELGEWLKNLYAADLTSGAVFTSSSSEEGHSADGLNENGRYWRHGAEDKTPYVDAVLNTPVSPKFLLLREEISLSQRIESFTLLYRKGGEWEEALRGTVVGNKRICALPKGIQASEWRLVITSCRCQAALKVFKLL